MLGQIDSLKTDSLRKEKRIRFAWAINWDARSSLIERKPVSIWGVNTGLIYGKKRHQVTIGYYWLSLNSYERLIDFRKNASKKINLDYYTKTDLFFFNFMFWRNIIDTNQWKLGIPLEVGIGATNTRATSFSTELQLWKRRDFFIPLQLGIYGEWKATRWVGLAVQLGRRVAIFERNLNRNFGGFYYSVGANIYTMKMFQDIKHFLRGK